ncbi:hypothetical protein [Spiroplasma endosymbiont of Notiophilus biguttatus]|uniref:hypothetical protein n=1 Tax=Spiroplasma endosymbiont of Notiophilus biguttatus TaxID=3066285 RepID=UPI00313C42DF
MDNFYAYIPLILKYIVILPYSLKDSKQVLRRTFKTHIKVAKHHVYLYAKEVAYKFNKIPSFEIVMLCLI